MPEPKALAPSTAGQTAELPRASVGDLVCPNNCTSLRYRANRLNPQAEGDPAIKFWDNAVMDVSSGHIGPGALTDATTYELSLVIADLDPKASPEVRAAVASIRALAEEFDSKVWRELAGLMKARAKGG